MSRDTEPGPDGESRVERAPMLRRRRLLADSMARMQGDPRVCAVVDRVAECALLASCPLWRPPGAAVRIQSARWNSSRLSVLFMATPNPVVIGASPRFDPRPARPSSPRPLRIAEGKKSPTAPSSYGERQRCGAC